MTNLARAAAGTIAYGSRADVPYGCGNVCAQAVLAGRDPRSGAPAYAVRIANNSQHALRATVRFGRARAAASELDVAPFSIVESLVPRAALARPDDRAIVEVRGQDLGFTLDAPPVTMRVRPLLLRTLAFAAPLAAALALAGAAVLGAFGEHARREATAHVVATPPHPSVRASTALARAPEEPSIRVGAARVIAGSTLRVGYAPSSRGDVWLLDGAGRVWAHERTNVRGTTTLRIPQSAAGRDLRVVVGTNARGAFEQRASIVAVIPDAANLAPHDEQPPHASATVAPTTVAAGNLITIRFIATHGEALVSLTDAQGTIVAQRDVPPNTARITLQAPTTAAPTTYDVVIATSTGERQDQTITPITVTP
ncbi:MAG: hypothetical protein KGN02_06085 [bacterium]|nr:hypothetical protein [bacterium]